MIRSPRPTFIKYTGDGAIAIWVKDSGEDFDTQLCNSIVSALRRCQIELPGTVEKWEKNWRVLNLPRQARVGICHGSSLSPSLSRMHFRKEKPLTMPDTQSIWPSDCRIIVRLRRIAAPLPRSLHH
jgi:hypothetical protein